MLYFYGTVDHYVDKNNYPVPVRLDIGDNWHGLMHLAMHYHAHEYKRDYKQIKKYKKEVAMKATVWAISESKYYYLLTTKWVPMTNRRVQESVGH